MGLTMRPLQVLLQLLKQLDEHIAVFVHVHPTVETAANLEVGALSVGDVGVERRTDGIGGVDTELGATETVPEVESATVFELAFPLGRTGFAGLVVRRYEVVIRHGTITRTFRHLYTRPR